MSGNIIQLNEDLIKNNLKDLVRSSVEETLNALLDHEADELVNADKYERSGDRNAGKHSRSIPGCEISALYSSLLPERIHCSSQREGP